MIRLEYLPRVEIIIKKLFKADRMVKGVVICDRGGNSLIGIWRPSSSVKNMELEETASLASAMYGAGEKFAGGTLGKLDVIALDYNENKIKIFLKGSGDRAIIALVTGMQADTSGVKNALRKCSKEIGPLMEAKTTSLAVLGKHTESVLEESKSSIASEMANALKDLEKF
jgi:hypothetical protein